MKPKNFLVYFIVAFTALAGLFIYSCTKESSHTNNSASIPEKVIEEICPNCESYDFWLPPNTIIEEIDGENDRRIVFTAPEGYIYYGYTTDNSLIEWSSKDVGGGNTVTVTCDCTEGSDDKCSPVGHDGTVNCVISPGCTSCDRKEKVSNPIAKTEFQISEGGFVNPGLGVTFAKPEDDLPYAFEALLHYPEVKQQLDRFMLQFYRDLAEIPIPIGDEETLTAPDGYKFVVLNVYGRALVTILPSSVYKSTESAGGATYSCPCNGTSGKCKSDSNFGYYFCKKDSSSPCDKACNTMTVTDNQKDEAFIYTFYYF